MAINEHVKGSAAWTKAERRKYHKAYRSTPEGRLRVAKGNLMQAHRMTLEQYETLYAAQRGVCAICGKAITKAYTAAEGGKRGPKTHGAHVDHDHACCAGQRSCGRCVRGLLCHHCNHGLGAFRDDPRILRLAVEYLLRPFKA